MKIGTQYWKTTLHISNSVEKISPCLFCSKSQAGKKLKKILYYIHISHITYYVKPGLYQSL